MNTLEVLSELLKNNPCISALTFCQYPRQKLLQERLSLDQTEKYQFESAIKVRDSLHLPFWDAMMLTYFNIKNPSTQILKSAIAHNGNCNTFTTRDISRVRTLIESDQSVSFSFNSKVIFDDDSCRHVFLLDFHIPPSGENLRIVSDVLAVLTLHGYILESGESYHFIGRDFFSLEDVISLLAKSLLFSPIVDRAWIAHQLLERSCSLRVCRKHNIIPFVVGEV